ncbi:YcxB family protein [Hymenobacter sp. DG01]|uniref:YcxB family protein n=1 Tax=Hymenobacter sp. DG01 TaxID=2584940 RepID=UPI00111E963E|nr:YcxB family protein [Hymenobacter sp. DG01]
MPSLRLPATPPTFAEYQLIHQTQQQRRYPDRPNSRRPATSDSWKQKVQLWLAGVFGGSLYFWLQGPGAWLAWALLTTLLTGLGLLHEWWEYRKAYREYQLRPVPTGFQLKAEGLVVEQATTRQFYPWSSFYRILHLDDLLLFYTSIEYCFYLDLRRVPPPATPADVLNLLRHPEVAGA